MAKSVLWCLAGAIHRMGSAFVMAKWNVARFPAFGLFKSTEKCLYDTLKNCYEDEGMKGIGVYRIRC